ncbi:MAG: zf-HC2 domain-containing protein [Acidobacteria bacterium]|nr:zf-HC2 domain-containing protein [Acidobacteriota bacterium]
MNCQAFEEQVTAYLDGELRGSELTRFEQHMKECTLCAMLIENIQENIAIFQDIPDLAPPPHLAVKIMEATRVSKKGLRGNPLEFLRLEFPLVPRLAAAALVLLFMLTLGFNLLTQYPADMTELQQGDADLVSLVDYNSNRLVTKAVQAYQNVEESYETAATFFTGVKEFIESNYEQVKSAFRGQEKKEEEKEPEPKEMNQTQNMPGHLSKSA